MAEVQAVKVERSRARGHVASNTLTAWTVAIHWRARFCLSPPALSNIHTQSLTKSTLTTLRFFEASAVWGKPFLCGIMWTYMDLSGLQSTCIGKTIHIKPHKTTYAC